MGKEQRHLDAEQKKTKAGRNQQLLGDSIALIEPQPH